MTIETNQGIPLTRKKELQIPGSLETSVCKCGPGAVCSVEAILNIDDRGQMVLPKDVREKAGIGTGDKLALVSWGKNGNICCLALTKVENLNGAVRDLLEPLIRQQE